MPPDGWPTLADVHAAVVRVERQLGELRAEVRAVRADQRLRALEGRRWPLPSLSVLVSLGALGAALWSVLGG